MRNHPLSPIRLRGVQREQREQTTGELFHRALTQAQGYISGMLPVEETPTRLLTSVQPVNILSYACIAAPVARVEGAILQHIEQKGVTPAAILVSSLALPALEANYAQVKHRALHGLYRYFTGFEIIELPVVTETEAYRWRVGRVVPGLVYTVSRSA
jgi:hypothetical protein